MSRFIPLLGRTLITATTEYLIKTTTPGQYHSIVGIPRTRCKWPQIKDEFRIQVIPILHCHMTTSPGSWNFLALNAL